MSLTQGTILSGVTYLTASIIFAIMGGWLVFSFCLAVTILFSLIIVKPYNSDVRKLIYYIHLGAMIAGTVSTAIFFIYAFASDWD